MAYFEKGYPEPDYGRAAKKKPVREENFFRSAGTGKDSFVMLSETEEADSEDTEEGRGEEEGSEEASEEVREKTGEETSEETGKEPRLPRIPEESKPFMGMRQGIAYWGFSQKGESHKKNGLPCQDRCRVLVSGGDFPIIIAAIADGVGSCALSHYGAAIAVELSTAFLKEQLDACPDKKFDDREIGDLLRETMQYAYDSVRQAAEELEQLEYSFQSTLTIALYDGTALYVSHAGDDGVVALTEEGELELVTSRIKGEEASSVYPLQAGPGYWQVFKVDGYVNGFVMATDGVLDAFVRGEKEGNKVYYPFIQPAFETEQKNRREVEEVRDFYYDYMAGKEYRRTVTDDLTLVVVTNQNELDEKKFPVFDEEAWRMETREYQEKVKAALYPDQEEKREKEEEDFYGNGQGAEKKPKKDGRGLKALKGLFSRKNR